MSTRDDVAKLAKVSTATVSRVLNDPESVSQEKVRRVQEAARQLKYIPDKNASALRRNGTGTIMFLERTVGGPPQSDARFYTWFYADIIRAIKSVVDKSMYQLTLHSYTKPEDIRDIRKHHGADGIIAYDPGDQQTVDAIASLKIPYVVCEQGMRRSDRVNLSYIDEEHGGFIAGEKLRAAGHTKPAHVTGALGNVAVCRDRWDGFQKAFAGIKPVMINGTLGMKGGYESGTKLGPQIKTGLVDCIFTVNDLTAVGVIHALMAQGIRIPHDVSIIGYDNLPFIDTLPFRLTTIDIRMSRAYLEGAQLLLRSIRDGSRIHNNVKPELVEGESVRKR